MDMNMKQNKIYGFLQKWIPVLILLLYPLRKVNTGIDLMDGGYSLGNYRFFTTMNQVWKLATYLANVLGAALSRLPFGNTWIGMNVYTALLTGITAAGTYCALRKRLQHPVLIWLGEMLALSICWAPSTNLYQYLGYYLMTAAVLVLYHALTNKNNICYITAGIILGLAVGVRMPNITYAALILPVWYYAWLTKDRDWFIHTLYCIGGYVLGLLVPLGVIAFKYGVQAYPEMIASLFGMTDTATDYKPTSMIMAMFGDYIQYSVWLILFLLYLLAGLVLFRIASGRFVKVKKVLYLLGLAVILRFCYGRGMFGFDYTGYFSMYKWVTVYLLIVIILCIYCLVDSKISQQQKLWSAFMPVIIFITPLGSNNGLYPIISNLFIMAPVSFVFLYEIFKNVREEYVFVCKSMVIFIIGCTFVQCFLFGVFFHFHDALPKGEQYVKTEIPGSISTKNMYTTVDKKEELEALGGYLTQNHLTEKKVLLYGEIPAISYIFDMEPAVYTTWADLRSNTLERLQADLDAITTDYPVVIVTDAIGQELSGNTSYVDEKLDAIAQFLSRGNYQCGYAQKGYYVYTSQ